MTDEQALSRYARTADPDAFAVLVDRHQSLVWGVCQRKLKSHADRQDACQETFIKLAQHAGKIQGNLCGWLHRVATNICTDHIRSETARKKREQQHGQAVNRRANASASGLANASIDIGSANHPAEAWQAALDDALASLASEDRSLIVACHLSGQTQQTIAESLHVSEATVSRRMQKAMAKLRQAMKQNGVTLTVAALATCLATARAQATGTQVMINVARLLEASNQTALPAQAVGNPLAMSSVSAQATVPGLFQLACVMLLAAVGVGVGSIGAMGDAADARARSDDLKPVSAASEVEGETLQPLALPVAMEGVWQIGESFENGDAVVAVVDSRNGLLTIGKARPDRVAIKYQLKVDGDGRQWGEVLRNEFSPWSEGSRVSLSLEQVDRNVLRLRLGRLRGAGEIATHEMRRLSDVVQGLKVSQHEALVRIEKSVDGQRFVAEGATLAELFEEMGVSIRYPFGRVEGDLPTQRFDLAYEGSVRAGHALGVGSQNTWLRRLIEVELGWRVRRVREMQVVDVLKTRVPGVVLLEEKEKMHSGKTVRVGNHVYYQGSSLPLGSYASQYRIKGARRIEVEESLGMRKGGQGQVTRARFFEYEDSGPWKSEEERMQRFLSRAGLVLVPEEREVTISVLERIPEGERLTDLDQLFGWFWRDQGADRTLLHLLSQTKQFGGGFEEPSSLRALEGMWQTQDERGDLVIFSGAAAVAYEQNLRSWASTKEIWGDGYGLVSGVCEAPFESLYRAANVGFIEKADLQGLVVAVRLRLPVENVVSGLLRVEGDRMEMCYLPGNQMPSSFDEVGGETLLLKRVESIRGEDGKPLTFDDVQDQILAIWPQVLGECPPEQLGGAG